ncbi:MAG TPA: bifunctional 2-C-methyl-D-erythritol 4-phosphate cytidylyltransferase/2-C-methyl-D-erythritol 2,4-cyclodiphosphate synthase [Stellaceae bacterium]|jgi:2-C-methyl-D-erythritol 4-phosphate cytidylyltransferase/2-C-methyl-D-erythritol 2,4-cyclodiphosphate synthase|nr:bifunctional 2-C-methyl-D-erythritol 4-phosphate cytidylyltransferase/2-C-methyl-D-erythritol 2,4-cyclodiphosphate synthase [Stellaceae bacterium]
MSECIALVVAAGRGTRLGGERPKQYRTLGGQVLLRHSVERLAKHPRIDRVRVVYHQADRDLYNAAVAGLDILPPVPGGAARQDSARLGLESLESLAPARVLIHDAARPFIDQIVVDRVLDALAQSPGAIPALPVADTVKRGEKGVVTETLDRGSLWRVQTPQGFDYRAILAAHRAVAGLELTDDAAVAERAGLTVRLVEGAESNFKVTTTDDYERAEKLIAGGTGDYRSGQGFDVHAFGPGDHIWLCGLKVPHSHGLVGHSDADVGLHALTDAILGALGAGDIGMHFPPSDPKWRGAPSHLFLRHAADLVARARGRIVHVDVTMMCEAPRIGPHRETMVAKIAEILGLPTNRVSVKATTTEKLGFLGRGEGMAAQAIATLQLP